MHPCLPTPLKCWRWLKAECHLNRLVVFPGSEQDQVDYLNAIHTQIGGDRLAFWIYLLINDFNLNSYARIMDRNGQNQDDINTLGMFSSVGLTSADRAPKAALSLWDSFRE